MKKTFKNDLRFIVNSVNFDVYRETPSGASLTFQFNESSKVILSNNLDSVLVNLITTMYASNDKNITIFNLAIKSSVEMKLLKKLEFNDKDDLKKLPDDIRIEAEKISSNKSIEYINNFFSNTIFSTLKIKKPDQ